MAWLDIANNQMITFTDAQGGGFTLNAGQSNVNSTQCMTKAQALAKYDLIASNMVSYAANQLVPKSAWAPVLTNVVRGFSNVSNNSGGSIFFNPGNSIEYIKCIYVNRSSLGYGNSGGFAAYCNGAIQIGSQLYTDSGMAGLLTLTGYYVIDLNFYSASLSSNYNLTPPGSIFMLQLSSGTVVSIANFNSITDCPPPCTGCP